MTSYSYSFLSFSIKDVKTPTNIGCLPFLINLNTNLNLFNLSSNNKSKISMELSSLKGSSASTTSCILLLRTLTGEKIPLRLRHGSPEKYL